LIDSFVEEFNKYMAEVFGPTEVICVDESISRWYDQGGHWINIGLPMYVAINRKPDNGCKIQYVACGKSGIMIWLRLVKAAEEEDRNVQEHDNGLLHGTIVLKELVYPWACNGRIVFADSYFASDETDWVEIHRSCEDGNKEVPLSLPSKITNHLSKQCKEWFGVTDRGWKAFNGCMCLD
jgi:hypothetical protein